jgi:sugar lactone lactonase YvrE
VAVTRDGDSVYVSSEDDAIVHFDRSGAGALTPQECIQDDDVVSDDCADEGTGLGGADSIAISRDGTSLYVTSENDNALARLKRDTGNGELVSKGCIEDKDEGTDECADKAKGMGEPAVIAITSDGSSLYMSAESGASIATFDRKESGSLDPHGCVEDRDVNPNICGDRTDGLDGVEGLALSPDDAWLYSAANSDDAIVRFARSN